MTFDDTGAFAKQTGCEGRVFYDLLAVPVDEEDAVFKFRLEFRADVTTRQVAGVTAELLRLDGPDPESLRIFDNFSGMELTNFDVQVEHIDTWSVSGSFSGQLINDGETVHVEGDFEADTVYFTWGKD